ncbi:MAG: hypothetical protein HPY73_00605 [Methanomassiliicoccales archaeon]|nr:MAG: hypothetical protein HPY73_00605 [Methanomassiliicoccales archaeon]
MRVLQVRCPQCSRPIYSKMKDIVFYCDNCQTMHIRNGQTKVLDYEIADYVRNATSDKKFMPFWRVWCNFSIHDSKISGGSFAKLAEFIRGENGAGSIFMFIPASELDVGTFKHLAMELTLNPPRYSTRLDFGEVARLPLKLSNEEAEEVADFIFVTIQADKPGVLQKLDYSLTCRDAKLVYLPFIMTQGGPKPSWK